MYDNNMLPLGYRFYPTEEELVEFYLRNKLDGKRDHDIQRVIPVVNIYHHNPSELPGLRLSKTVFLPPQDRGIILSRTRLWNYSTGMGGEVIRHDTEQWFFFIPIQDREARGGRPTRVTTQGYWKATGSPGFVYSSNNNRIIGGKRTMVFYKGRAPNGKKTQWKMNEYKAVSLTNNHVTNLKFRHEFSLCRVYKKSKCVRAFDRRPAGSGLFLSPHQPFINVDHHDQANNNNNNNNNIETSPSLGEQIETMGNFNDLFETPVWNFEDWNFW